MSYYGSNWDRPYGSNWDKAVDTKRHSITSSTPKISNRHSNLAQDAMKNSYGRRQEVERSSKREQGELNNKFDGLKISDQQQSKIGSVSAYTDLGKTDTTWRDYKLGDIVVVPHVAPSYDPNLRSGDDHAGLIKNTGPAVGKMRPAIVIGIYGCHMICLPVLTSSGRGIPGKIYNECIWLREWNDCGSEWDHVPETNYAMIQPGHRPMQPNTYFRLTIPFAIDYVCPMHRVSRITETSYLRLKKMLDLVTEQGQLPVMDQRDFFHEGCRKIPVSGEYEALRKAQFVLKAKELGSVSMIAEGFTVVKSSREKGRRH